MLINDYYFHLEFENGEEVLEAGDPSHYLYITSGNVVGTDENQKKIQVGKFRLSYIDVWAAMNAKDSVFDIFDCSQETCDYYSAIFDIETSDLSPELTHLFKDDIWLGNVLILDRLEILPEFRGNNLGLVVMRRLIERFGAGASVVAMKPFPLQREWASEDENEWRKKMKLGDLGKDLRRATAKLRRHYAKLGFKHMKGTPFMFRDAQQPLPSPEELYSKSK